MHYRETVVWNRVMEVAREIYRLTAFLPREEVYARRSQLTRAAVSVPSNIAEGWTQESKRETAQFLAIAQGSETELETQVSLCEQHGWFPKDETVRVRSALDQAGRMCTVMRRKARID